MKSKFLQLMLIVWALTVSFAANAAEEIKNGSDANVYGHVIDKKTGEHLPYVVIQVKGTTIATTTDDTGHYFLKNLPNGIFTITHVAFAVFILFAESRKSDINSTRAPPAFVIY